MSALLLSLSLAFAVPSPATITLPVVEMVQPDGTVDLPEGVPVVVQGHEVDFAVSTFQKLQVAIGEKRWGLVASILLMAMLAAFSWLFVRVQELRDKLRQYMPEVALAISVLGYCGIALASLPIGATITDWWAVILPAIKTGAAAVGFYELLAKRVLGFWGPKLFDLIRGLLAKKSPEAPRP